MFPTSIKGFNDSIPGSPRLPCLGLSNVYIRVVVELDSIVVDVKDNQSPYSQNENDSFRAHGSDLKSMSSPDKTMIRSVIDSA